MWVCRLPVHIGPRRMHCFYGNLRRICDCPAGRCGHRPLQDLQQYVSKEREPMDLFSPVTDLRGVGPARAAALPRLGIFTL